MNDPSNERKILDYSSPELENNPGRTWQGWIFYFLISSIKAVLIIWIILGLITIAVLAWGRIGAWMKGGY